LPVQEKYLSIRRSHRSSFVAAAVVSLAAALSSALHVGAAPAAAIPAATSAANAIQPAQRLRPLPPDNFPMQVKPRCAILDNFGDARSGGRSHEGSDMLATIGQEVYAMVDGTLTYQAAVGDGSNGSQLSGNLWKLTAATGGTYYIYAHLSAFADGLTRGSLVAKGQVIGYVGDTGNPGPGNYHLHFEVHPGGGAAVNPLSQVTVPSGCTVS